MPAMTVKQLSEKYGLHPLTVKRFCSMSGSPAYKAGKGKTSRWICDEDSFEEWLLRVAEDSKS